MGGWTEELTMPRTRLDLLLVERGLVASRERARALILAGQVLVDGQRASKAGDSVTDDVWITLITPDHPYVSRGGLKLDHALDQFHIDVIARTALDIGASTGGFTDVLLHRGAAHVVALDVGHGQLDWRLRNDRRVTVLERVNARHLTPETFANGPALFEIVTIDVSFISLRLILPVVPPLLAPQADVVTLVKPQFEAGRAEVGKGGIVSDPAVHRRVIDEVIAEAERVGLTCVAETPSPIDGMEGNREFLLHLRPAGEPDAA
jgi:23S rRNA (cytidine1920-2'-O)/16S rRNA (cytidine1409-2'-O)-methyltransferase